MSDTDDEARATIGRAMVFFLGVLRSPSSTAVDRANAEKMLAGYREAAALLKIPAPKLMADQLSCSLQPHTIDSVLTSALIFTMENINRGRCVHDGHDFIPFYVHKEKIPIKVTEVLMMLFVAFIQRPEPGLDALVVHVAKRHGFTSVYKTNTMTVYPHPMRSESLMLQEYYLFFGEVYVKEIPGEVLLYPPR